MNKQAARLGKVGVSGVVWTEFTKLSAATGAVNLGQGIPSMKTPEFVQEACFRAVKNDHNQYARAWGHLPLVQGLAKRYSQILDREIDPLSQVLVSNGASQALFNSFQAFVNPGDQVVLIEPFFDIYEAQALVCGATIKSVPMRTQSTQMGNVWTFDPKELEKVMNQDTKILVLNTPHNPTGTVYDRQTLMDIAKIVERFPNVIVVCDEVYEHLVFEGAEHIPFASLPGMFDRTVTISSAGKTFSVTGWKIGWAVGPNHLLKSMELIHRFICFSVSTPMQDAVASALEEAHEPYLGGESYYEQWRGEYLNSKNILVEGLKQCGLKFYQSEGSFFIVADCSNVNLPEKYSSMIDVESGGHVSFDWAFCRFLTTEIGVAAIPMSAFYLPDNKHLSHHLIRLAFCKPESEIREAVSRLQNLSSYL